ncbi:Dual specificity protein phosphatase 14 [Dermatophagoides pteronyssinus]|uniref:Dual specificity protein phosphatase 14 n=1 Tax=Dermatophagoides pteronyssinus TaxID=6956 RepID=A0ABQ8JPB3_DERPT|nr:Dual specificity protein phosphatase 14 [Dermatophagoides pteronyssinus]
MGNTCFGTNTDQNEHSTTTIVVSNRKTIKNNNRKPKKSTKSDDIQQQQQQLIQQQLAESLKSSFYSDINQKTFEFHNIHGKNLQRTNELLRYCLQCDTIQQWKQLSSKTSLFHNNPLFRDQSLTKTTTNKPIIQLKTDQVFTRKKLQQMRSNLDRLPPDTALIIMPPFSNLDMIVPGIYQTGTTGLVIETLNELHIKLIINATYEMPLFKHTDIITFRVPIEDDSKEPIENYFDDVADLMEATRLRGYGSIVHCMAGVSRSAALILAYMIKYTTFTLFEAFLHVKSLRQPIRPNIGFIQQLIEYESRLNNGRKTIEIEQINYEQNPDIKIIVPKFYRTHFPELYDVEVRRQLSYWYTNTNTNTNTNNNNNNNNSNDDINNPSSTQTTTHD